MKLQLAIDLLDQKKRKLAQEVEEFIDIVEIGTPIVINEGLSVEHMSKSVTNTQVLADLKIMDASYEVSRKIRCDIVTILGVSEDASIKSAIAEAHNNGKELLVDMIAVQNLEQRELDKMGRLYCSTYWL